MHHHARLVALVSLVMLVAGGGPAEADKVGRLKKIAGAAVVGAAAVALSMQVPAYRGVSHQIAANPDHQVSIQLDDARLNVDDAAYHLTYRGAYTTSKVGSVPAQFHPTRWIDGHDARDALRAAKASLGQLDRDGALVEKMDHVIAQVPDQNDIEALSGKRVDQDSFASQRTELESVSKTLSGRAKNADSTSALKQLRGRRTQLRWLMGLEIAGTLGSLFGLTRRRSAAE
jgi:hypothetical protein